MIYDGALMIMKICTILCYMQNGCHLSDRDFAVIFLESALLTLFALLCNADRDLLSQLSSRVTVTVGGLLPLFVGGIRGTCSCCLSLILADDKLLSRSNASGSATPMGKFEAGYTVALLGFFGEWGLLSGVNHILLSS